MRRETPGKFCFAMCTCLSIIAYIGSFVSSFCLFYYLTVGGLIVPGSLKYIIRNYPEAQELFVNLRIMEEVKCEKVKGKNKKHGDEVDGSMVAGMVGDMRGAADKVQSIVQNVCSTLQTGVSSLASTLPDMQQVAFKLIYVAMCTIQILMHIFILTFLNIRDHIFLAGKRTKRVERGWYTS